MKSEAHQIIFNKLLKNLGIDPMEIEVIDPEIVTDKEANFRAWFAKLGGNVHFSDECITKGWQNHLQGDNRVIINYQRNV